MRRLLDVLFIAHDTAGVAPAAEELLRSGFDVTSRRVDTETALADALDARVPDVVLCRFEIPGFPDLRSLVVTRERASHVPFILIGDADEYVIGRAMRQGATDYLRDGQLSQLGTCVQRALVENIRVRCQQAQADGPTRDVNDLLAAVLATCSFLLKSIEHSDPRRAKIRNVEPKASTSTSRRRESD
jgi:DNA-binding NtrC family response regulator